MTPLCALAEKYGTDKYSKHRYTEVYYNLLRDRIDTTKRVLEIGIKRGASLRMWEEFFPNAQIFGIDIKPKNLFNSGRIVSFLGDQGKPETLRAAATISTASGPLDFVVDDGKHKAIYQITAALALLPFLAADGIYVIEDVRHGPGDSPESIISRMPRGFACELILTTEATDSGMMVIRREGRAVSPRERL